MLALLDTQFLKKYSFFQIKFLNNNNNNNNSNNKEYI